MGLFSSIKKITGLVKDKGASALGNVKSFAQKAGGTIGKIPILGSAAKLAGKIIKPVAKVGLFAAKRFPAVTAITAVGVVAKLIRGKKKEPLLAQQVAATIGKPSITQRAKSVLGSAAKIAGGVAVAGAGLYAAEQVAEAIGVRGGAGFVGRRKIKKGRKRKKAYGRRRRKRRTYGRRRKGTRGRVVSFTTKDGRRVKFHTKRGWRQDRAKVSQETWEQRYRRRKRRR